VRASDQTEIASHDWRIKIDAARGGQIVECTWRKQEILASGQPGLWPVDQHAGCFPLVPFSNRIRDAEFTFEGSKVRLSEPDFAMPHALHGIGWRQAWKIGAILPDSVAMVLDHGVGQWPWPFRATQVVRVDETGLSLSLSIVNKGKERMPAGLGFHPYFPRTSDVRVRMDAEGYWRTDPASPGLPVAWRAMSPGSGFGEFRRLNGMDLDTCFTGWSGYLTLDYPTKMLRISMFASHQKGNLIIYHPGQGAVLCCEPASHVNNALNTANLPTPQAMDALAPGETMSITFTLSPQNLLAEGGGRSNA
jgi:aldose 1-epimerase